MDQTGKIVLGVGALVLAIGVGLLGGRIARDSAAESARVEAARLRVEAEQRAAATAAARRTSTLQRIVMFRSINGAVPGIGVCASEELTNCEVRYGDPTRTLVWRAPRIVVPESCEHLVLNVSVACAPVAADGSVQQFGECFMMRGWMPVERGLVTTLDLRETQTTPNHASIQCDQGRYEAVFDPEPASP